MKRLAIIVLRVVLALLLLVLLLAGASQTQLFRDRLRSVALSNLQSLFNADVYLGELRGNLVAGFSIDSLSIAVDGIPVVATNDVEFRYNIFALPGRTLSLGSITLAHPTVRLLRDHRGEWNFARVIRPTTPDSQKTSPKEPTAPWVVDLQALEILDGHVLVVDSSGLEEYERDREAVDYRNLTLRNVTLAMSGHSDPDEKRVSIDQLSFDMDHPALHVRALTFEARVTDREVGIKNLRFISDRSDLSFTGDLKNIDLLDGVQLASLQHSPITATLTIGALDCGELRQWIPALSFLNGAVTGALAVSGEFGHVDVHRLDLHHGKTNLSLRGMVGNLHNPSALTLDIRMEGNTIDAGDLQVLLPGLSLPDLAGLGVTAVSARFKGEPLNFTAGISLDSKAGAAQVPEVSMRIGGPLTLDYNGSVTFQNLNLAAVVGDPSLESRLTGSASARGAGVTIREMLGAFEVRLDSSSFREEPISDTWLSLAARERRLLGRVQVNAGPARVEATGMLDESQISLPTFSLNGEISNLNLHHLFRDPAFDSDISLKVDASGSGLTWEDVDGTLLIDLARSRYRTYMLDSMYLQLTVTQLDSTRKLLSFGSPMLDAVVDGVFDLPSFTKLCVFEVQNISRELGQRLAPIDSSLGASVNPQDLARLGQAVADEGSLADAEFTVQLKSLEPLSAMLGGARLTGTGMVAGEVRGGYNDLSVSSNLQVEEFAYGNEEQGGLFVERANVALDVRHLTPASVLQDAQLWCSGTVSHFAVNRVAFDSLSCELRYADNIAVFAIGTTADRQRVRLDAIGTARLQGDTVSVMLSHLETAFEAYQWIADSGAHIELTGKGLALRDVALKRGPQMVGLSGGMNTDGTVHASVQGSNLDLDALKYVLRQESPGVRRSIFEGTADLTLSLSGSLAEPEYQGAVRVHDVLVRGMSVGSVKADLSYRQRALRGHIEANSGGTGQNPQLTIDGVIPINLAFVGVDENRLTEDPVDIAVRGDSFQLAVFEPFLPAFSEFKGLMSCDLHLGGHIQDPMYEGTITVANGSFLFEPNNIRYEFGGNFRAAGNRIRAEGVTVRNVPEDARGKKLGEITIDGDLALRNFRPGDFNLNITGDLLVVKESTRRASLEVSGELFAEIGQGGLQFTGEIDHSLLKGKLLIRNSTLVFPPSQVQIAEQSATSVPVVNVDDTTKVAPRKRRAAEQYFTSSNGQRREMSREDESPSVSFIDGMKYDLSIETSGGSTSIEMIFNSLTAEKLVATINGQFSIHGDKSQWLGDLTISQAYYNFLKRFDAEGSIRYTGDFLNPELNITATYQSTRTIQDSTGRPNERVVVTFKITGTKKEPKIETSMTIDDIDYALYKGVKSNDVQSDAIQFIVYGNFPLTMTQRNEASTDIQKQLGLSAITGAASMLTGALSEFLRTQTGFINSVDIRYGGVRGTEIRLSGSALKGFWRFGGSFVEEPLTNAEFSLLYSFEAIFGQPSLRNLMFEFERRVESSALQLNDLKRVNSARLFYRFSF